MVYYPIDKKGKNMKKKFIVEIEAETHEEEIKHLMEAFMEMSKGESITKKTDKWFFQTTIIPEEPFAELTKVLGVQPTEVNKDWRGTGGEYDLSKMPLNKTPLTPE